MREGELGDAGEAGVRERTGGVRERRAGCDDVVKQDKMRRARQSALAGGECAVKVFQTLRSRKRGLRGGVPYLFKQGVVNTYARSMCPRGHCDLKRLVVAAFSQALGRKRDGDKMRVRMRRLLQVLAEQFAEEGDSALVMTELCFVYERAHERRAIRSKYRDVSDSAWRAEGRKRRKLRITHELRLRREREQRIKKCSEQRAYA